MVKSKPQKYNDPSSSNYSSQPPSYPSTPFPFAPTFANLSQKALDLIAENLRKDSEPTGVYTIRGVTYLEGQFHEQQIVKGRQCEVFVDSVDEWCPAEILSCRSVDIPATQSVQRTFDVQYTLPSPSPSPTSPEPISYTLNDIKSDKIRLFSAAPVKKITPFNRPEAERGISETTGIGKWQTVSVTIVDEEEERIKQKEREVEEEKERARELEEEKIANERVLLDVENEEDALSSFDPYNTGVYRGIVVSGIAQQSAEVWFLFLDFDFKFSQLELLTEGKEVQFKKRKDNENSTKRNRNVRRKGSDE